ncbi:MULTISPECIES: hypothetical protein [unclassified Sutcliffiella]|uniref:DUF6414 family protein n=1 Tax=unclassified Sutcliffiella TaxID=2837532 RepID=UPI0030D37234
MGKSITYRDLIYFNADKVQSILAQINKGLIESTIESSGSQHEVGIKAKTSKMLELLGIPLSFEGGYQYSRSKGLQEEKSLHDFALTQLLDTLPYNDVSNLDRDALNKERTFVRVTGKIGIYDYQNFGDLIGDINTIDDLLGSNRGQSTDELEQFSQFILTGYKGLTTTEITNKKGINFIGAIEPKFLRETPRNMVFKYGANPKGEWEMLCQITKIPSNNATSIEDAFQNFGSSINTENLGKEKSMANFVNSMVKEFSTIYDFFASVAYPNISVEPVAIYKEMELK